MAFCLKKKNTSFNFFKKNCLHMVLAPKLKTLMSSKESRKNSG